MKKKTKKGLKGTPQTEEEFLDDCIQAQQELVECVFTIRYCQQRIEEILDNFVLTEGE